MDVWKLCSAILVLLTPLFCKASLVVHKKIINKQSDVTLICRHDLRNVTLISCAIQTERSRGVECHLSRRYQQDTVNDCNSNFTFRAINQSVFLDLSIVAKEDSGSYVCQCSHRAGTDSVHLNITVEDNITVQGNITFEKNMTTEHIPKPSSLNFYHMAIITSAVTITCGISLGVISCCVTHSRNEEAPEEQEMVVHTVMFRKEEPIIPHLQQDEDYSLPFDAFVEKENVLYMPSRPHKSTSTLNINSSHLDLYL